MPEAPDPRPALVRTTHVVPYFVNTARWIGAGYAVLLALVLLLVLENNCTTEDEDENGDEDEPVQRFFHTGSLARFNVRTGSEFDQNSTG